MQLENNLKNSSDVKIIYENNTLYADIFPSSSEYALFLKAKGADEKLLKIISSGKDTVPLDKNIFSMAEEIFLVDIYSDEVLFRYVNDIKKEEIKKEEKVAKIESSAEKIPEDAAIILPKEERKKEQKQTPPVLYTKKRTLKKTDLSFLKKLKPFDEFNCLMPECDMRIFDEEVIKKEKISVNYHEMNVSAWYPYLGYSDITAKDSPLPKRLIGSSKINGNEYLTYAVLTDIKRGIQPFFGSTGFSYLATTDDKFGYWMMYLDTDTGNVAYPYDEEVMDAEETA